MKIMNFKLVWVIVMGWCLLIMAAPGWGSPRWNDSRSRDHGRKTVDADGDGFRSHKDCNDNDPDIYPGAVGIDQDCDGADLPGGGESGNGPHANLTYADYPANCLSCHAGEAAEVHGGTHYQWMGAAPDMLNAPDRLQGKLTNAVNSYCINILGNWAVCGTCHVGRGQRPDATRAGLENIDCLVCHSAEYAGLRTRLPDGSMGVEAPTDAMVQGVHRPTRDTCLVCHAKAGGGDGVKRGDLSMATAANSDARFDVHMNTGGPNLACQACHVFENHKTIGKGSDLRATDDPERGSEINCTACHTGKDGPSGHDSSKINDHVARVACQTCHIPVYAKAATETHRDWQYHHDMAPATGDSVQPGHPFMDMAADLIPAYRFWNRKSDNMLLGDDAQRTYDPVADTWPTSRPAGDVQDGKLYPFKYKTAKQPMTRDDKRLIALDTFEYLKVSGHVIRAVEQGLVNMGYDASTPYDWVFTDTYQLLNHGINPAADALQCTNCHGTGARMDLKADLGYQLKGSPEQVCTQCHRSKEERGFYDLHRKHVSDKHLECSHCHTFTRPERGLGGEYHDD